MMDLTISDQNQPVSLNLGNLTNFEEVKALANQAIWEQLEHITVRDALSAWFLTLAEKTRINYISGFNKLTGFGLVQLDASLQKFALVNHEAIIDQIKLIDEWSECTRQARAAAYISFTRFLNRRSKGLIPKAMPSKEGNSKTFFKVREKVKTPAMNREQWRRFLEVLEGTNYRECLIAKAILQGGKRISEVLSLHTDQIEWGRCKITYAQAKTKGMEKSTVITYPLEYIKLLKAYLGEREGLVFVTRNRKPLTTRYVASVFEKAGKAAGIPFKVTPHVLRASTVTYLKLQGFPDSDILRVTGHASAQMIYAYDKRSDEINASEKVSLI